jgi:hypothetical protein
MQTGTGQEEKKTWICGLIDAVEQPSANRQNQEIVNITKKKKVLDKRQNRTDSKKRPCKTLSPHERSIHFLFSRFSRYSSNPGIHSSHTEWLDLPWVVLWGRGRCRSSWSLFLLFGCSGGSRALQVGVSFRVTIGRRKDRKVGGRG